MTEGVPWEGSIEKFPVPPGTVTTRWLAGRSAYTPGEEVVTLPLMVRWSGPFQVIELEEAATHPMIG
jgi:hypothetical protein